MALVLGVLLGLVALAADHQSMRILIIVFSSGVSWATAAVAVGALSRDRFVAASAGLTLLLTAVLAYYVGSDLLDGGDTGWFSLYLASRAWAAVAIIGGPVAGVAGWCARFGGPWERPVAWGVLSGLVWGQGVQWAWSRGLSPDPQLVLALIAPPLVLAYVVRRGGAAPAIAALLASSAATAALWTRLYVTAG